MPVLLFLGGAVIGAVFTVALLAILATGDKEQEPIWIPNTGPVDSRIVVAAAIALDQARKVADVIPDGWNTYWDEGVEQLDEVVNGLAVLVEKKHP